MERRLESIKAQLQRIATILNEGESVFIERDRVTLQTTTQKITEFISIPARKTMAEKIRENITTYLLDLDREEPRDFVLPPEVPGETWDEKLDRSCRDILSLNAQGKSNSQILEAYYQMGSVLTEKGWSDVSRKKFNPYFPQAKGKAVWRISKRVYQLFSTRGEEYLYVVEHINITVL